MRLSEFLLGLLWQEVKTLTFMTPCTGRHLDEVVAVEGALAVVAHDAAIWPGLGRMFLSLDVRDLAALLSLPHVVALIAAL